MGNDLHKPNRDHGPSPPWTELPWDVTVNILNRLGSIDKIESAQKVCTTWRKVCQDPEMWRVIDMGNSGELEEMPYDLEIMCRHAVDRSQRQLEEINIEYVCTDSLLSYISERCRKLKRLRLAGYNSELSGHGLVKAVKNLPELEELHLYCISEIWYRSIEEIGQLCPKLKSFAFNLFRHLTYGYMDEDGYALAVAKSMPGLRHLRLIGCEMSNEGLQAILDGCPDLESLDLRACDNVDLDGDLGKRCSEQIKDLRLKDEPVYDNDWDKFWVRSKYWEYERYSNGNDPNSNGFRLRFHAWVK